jgi:GST-like protein
MIGDPQDASSSVAKGQRFVIDLYTWTTPNGRKVSIMLEELGLPYRSIPINITEDDQFEPDFLKISPNNKIPAIVDTETGISMMESAAIMLYLSKKTGGKLVPGDEAGYWRMMEWLMLQMGGVGPMLGQAHHFLHFNAGKAPYAEERYGKEAARIYGVLDKRLGEAPYLAGDELSIADIATWPWISRFEWQKIDLNSFENLARWYRELAARPAFRRGYHVPKQMGEIPMP